MKKKNLKMKHFEKPKHRLENVLYDVKKMTSFLPMLLVPFLFILQANTLYMKNIYVYIGKYIIYEMYMLIWKMYLFTYTGNFYYV